ncbi:hypothetical protein CMUS01_15831 [Colletotrichum musicola]|uniref:Uncharacterized protein n=1 Tax=Colletotrichum musicola TaxID=2175873 RepID=A0A8H6IT64_9PEZI|nr:hypothetical protein CMUS01_15831 [Colletotrichum musicola]
MCHIAKATCQVCHEVQTILVEPAPCHTRPYAINYLTNEFHLPCDSAAGSRRECGWLHTTRFSTTVPKNLCKKCEAYNGGDYRDWLVEDVHRRKELFNYLIKEREEKGESWWRAYFC